jgi:hypothetical protein
MKRGIDAIGIDANPSSVFAAKVKTNWSLNPAVIQTNLNKIEKSVKNKSPQQIDASYDYFLSSGMLDRGWISPKPLKKALAIKTCIGNLPTTLPHKNALMLALVSEVVFSSANVKFGPELYCGPSKPDSKVYEGFKDRVQIMISDLVKAKSAAISEVQILHGDARTMSCLDSRKKSVFDFLITSPPYPTEHDYTRNSRLELVLLEKVLDKENLQTIKKNMIRSHTKGIYKEDNDSAYVNRFSIVRKLENRIRKAARSKTHGFARLYPIVMKEYFGGMRRHLKSVYPYLKKGAICAYVVGDQASYAQVPIPTSKILSHIAKADGFIEVETIHFRDRWSSSTSEFISENILILKKV